MFFHIYNVLLSVTISVFPPSSHYIYSAKNVINIIRNNIKI